MMMQAEHGVKFYSSSCYWSADREQTKSGVRLRVCYYALNDASRSRWFKYRARSKQGEKKTKNPVVVLGV